MDILWHTSFIVINLPKILQLESLLNKLNFINLWFLKRLVSENSKGLLQQKSFSTNKSSIKDARSPIGKRSYVFILLRSRHRDPEHSKIIWQPNGHGYRSARAKIRRGFFVYKHKYAKSHKNGQQGTKSGKKRKKRALIELCIFVFPHQQYMCVCVRV